MREVNRAQGVQAIANLGVSVNWLNHWSPKPRLQVQVLAPPHGYKL